MMGFVAALLSGSAVTWNPSTARASVAGSVASSVQRVSVAFQAAA